ncbi:hypothetical protein [Cardinium endosymbiont of Bemisia tabaci]|uniref:hypothetical protein n=1 Tax=Cardinium endosymbiont of Bemisia tabaci TaxID=672794 RepID=UPI001CB8516B|nr:hypothetical protein [Cardinium endosymbiont of Bemisia tabaci]
MKNCTISVMVTALIPPIDVYNIVIKPPIKIDQVECIPSKGSLDSVVMKYFIY